jgi:phage protein U
MEYVDKLQSGLKYMVEAGEVGRTNVEGMLNPVNGAINSMTSAADGLESIPFVGPAIGAKLQRIMGAISNAQSKVAQVAALPGRVTRGVAVVQERIGVLKEQCARATTAVGKLAAKVGPQVETVVPTAALAPVATPMPEAVSAYPHLLIMQPLTPRAQAYHFNIDTAAFDELRRSTAYRWATQERLTRRPAQQAVGMGEEKLTLKGAIFPGFKGGLKQLDTLRSIGQQLQPLMLTTGYGNVLGNWCLLSVDEEQSALLQGGIPRKQGFTLEFVRYGDDMQNI